MTGHTEDLEVRMKFTGDTRGASKAVQDLQRETAKLSHAERALMEQQRRRREEDRRLGVGSMSVGGGSGSTGSASGGGGGLPAFWRGVSGLTFGLVALEKSLSAAAKSAETFHASGRDLYKSILEGGNELLFGIPRKIGNSFDSLIYSRDAGKLGAESDLAEHLDRTRPIHEQRYVAGSALQTERRANEIARGQILPGLQSQLYGSFSDSIFGPRDSRSAAALQQLGIAERGQSAASQSASDTAIELEKQRIRLNGLKYRANAIRPDDHLNPISADTYNTRVETATKDLLAQEERILALMGQHKKNMAEVDKQNLAVMQARKGLSQAELDITREKLQANKSGAASFAMMDPEHQLALLDTARRAKGGQPLGPQELQLLAGSGLTGELGQRIATQQGEENPVFRQLIEVLGRETTVELEKREAKFKGELEITLPVQEAAIRDAASKALDEFLPRVEKIVNSVFERRLKLQDFTPKGGG